MFSREVSWMFYCKMGRIPVAASSQKLHEKNPPNHEKLNTVPFNGKKPQFYV